MTDRSSQSLWVKAVDQAQAIRPVEDDDALEDSPEATTE